MTESGSTGGTADGLPPSPPLPPPYPPSAVPGGGSAAQVVPAGPEEALEIGRAYFPPVGSPGGPIALFVHEFDIGYLIHAGYPAPEDPSVPPSDPGGSNIAISKLNGDVTTLPNFPPESAVEVYRQWYRPSTS